MCLTCSRSLGLADIIQTDLPALKLECVLLKGEQAILSACSRIQRPQRTRNNLAEFYLAYGED
jgi:hypothetical protein